MNKKIFELYSLPWQNPSEWFLFLNFVESYFDRQQIDNPVVVEIGVYENKQKIFYEFGLGAMYIGIDNSLEKSTPTIFGESHALHTLEKLNSILKGRKIDLLFIDACHTYEAVKRDYEIYSPYVAGIVALHDIYNEKFDVKKFWWELTTQRPEMGNKTFVTLRAKEGYANHGIGLVVEGE
jgi:hypothetical protein